jgi:predicted ATPase/class 3 adenylate cyclase
MCSYSDSPCSPAEKLPTQRREDPDCYVLRMAKEDAFLFTDIEGSTQLWQDHSEAMAKALALHDAALQGAVESAGGTVFKHTGDGIAARLTSADAAVEAAVTIQRQLREVDWPATGALRVRIGIHVGEAVQRDGDWFGTSLNTTARLMGAGHGGQILVSGSAWKAASETTKWHVIELGTHRLRDLAEPMTVWQVAADGLDDDFPPLRTLDAYASNLPRNLASFVGRDDLVGEAVQDLQASRIVTLTGLGGIGKTRLSQQIGATTLPTYPDGVWFIDLSSVSRAEEVAPSVGRVLRVRPRTTEPIATTIADSLRDSHMLIIPDNCEQVTDGAADVVEAVTATAPSVRFLATSREALGVDGELVIPLPGLDDAAAVALFEERAQATGSGYELGEDRATVAELCRRLDGLPLAIELAAARTRSMRPAEILDRIDQRFRFLRGTKRTTERHQTLRAMLDWSYDLLDQDERSLFERLAVFVGPFDLATAEQISSDDDLDGFDIAPLLDQLISRSLLSVLVDSEPTRYRMMETVRQYAAERLNASPLLDPMVDRHTKHYIRRARTLGAEMEDGAVAGSQVEVTSDIDNINAAISRLGTLGRHEEKMQAVSGLSLYWLTQGAQTARLRYEELVTDRELLSPPARFSLLLEAASINCEHGFVSRAVELLDLAAGVHNEHDVPLNALYYYATATAAEFDGRTADVLAAYEQGAQLAVEEDNSFVGTALRQRVALSLAETDLDAAQAIVTQVIADAIADGMEMFVATGQMLDGLVKMMRGDTAAADKSFTEAIAINDSAVYQIDLVAAAGTAATHLRAGLPDALSLAKAAVQAEAVQDAMPTMKVASAWAVALCWLSSSRVEDAARVLGWSEELQLRVGFGGIAWANHLREELRASLADTLPSPRFGELVAEGRQLTDAQAERLLLND